MELGSNLETSEDLSGFFYKEKQLGFLFSTVYLSILVLQTLSSGSGSCLDSPKSKDPDPDSITVLRFAAPES
jgi:hypothetical protein